MISKDCKRLIQGGVEMRKLHAEQTPAKDNDSHFPFDETSSGEPLHSPASDGSLNTPRGTSSAFGGVTMLPTFFSQTVVHKLLRLVKYFLPDHVFLLLSHLRRVGRFPNLKNPKTFNEMILRRCLHPAPQWSELTDKLGVRDYVKQKIGEQYLIPLITAPDAFTKEVFDSLPQSFVMKANHGCAFVKVVKDKSQTSFEELDGIAKKWLEVNFYRASRERHYRSIKPRLFFEKLLLDRSGKIPPDFKLHMFAGETGAPVIYTMVVSDRFGDVHGDFYDPQWNRLYVSGGVYERSEVATRCPPNWDEVLRVATLLSKGLGYVRVDLYVPDDGVYFGELTFTPGAGVFRFTPDRYDYLFGRLLKQTLDSSRLLNANKRSPPLVSLVHRGQMKGEAPIHGGVDAYGEACSTRRCILRALLESIKSVRKSGCLA
jgi:hypothetical protein